MKKLIVGMVAFLMAASGYAQNDLISSVFEKYSGKEGITVVNVSGEMLNMMAKAEMEKRDTVIQSKLTELRVLAMDECDKPAELNFKAEVFDKLDKSVYREMINVKESDKDIAIMIRESNGHVSEMLVIVGGSEENALIQIKGDILLRELTDLMGKFPMKGFEHMR